jgi:DNA (cytosine-5)-methyltransferase 1
MRYGSVCSGIEAATVAWHSLGWQPAWFSEIEKFPSAVLAHHYPTVPNYGDMTQHQEWPNEPINLLVGGTPCQSFSVAGLRKGLDDPRGNLMLTYGAIARQYRPTWLVWENVPGVLSSNRGRDFGTFLGMLAELGYGFAYRILDAQYFGVAQRRRRVFVVGHLGNWQRAAAVLFERESLSGNPAPSREKGQNVAGTIAARFGRSRNNHEELAWPAEVASTLSASFGSKLGLENQHALGGAQLFVPDVLGTLTARMMNALGARDIEEGAVLPCAFHNRQDPDVSGDITHPLGAKDNGLAVAQPITQFGDVAGSLTARHDSSPCADRGQNVVAQPINIYGGNKRPDRPEGGFYVRTDEPTSKTLDAASGLNPTCSQGGTAVMQPVAFYENQRAEVRLNDTAGSLTVGGGKPGQGYPAVMSAMQVRRLTPIECERLQGFPDGYTNIPWRNKPESPDGPRYKALGNSMAVPVMHWIGKRISEVENA